jgi:hypothetical protein
VVACQHEAQLLVEVLGALVDVKYAEYQGLTDRCGTVE